MKLAGAVFSWNTHAQKTVVLSSTKVEYMSLSDTSNQLVWVRNLFSKLGIELAPVLLYRDNQGSIHQQKKTCLQLPYNALLCLTGSVRCNKAL